MMYTCKMKMIVTVLIPLLENEATENTHAVKFKYIEYRCHGSTRQIQYFGGYPNAYWVTPSVDLSGNETYSNEDGSVSRTFYTSISSAIATAWFQHIVLLILHIFIFNRARIALVLQYLFQNI